MTTHEKETLREIGGSIREARRHASMTLDDIAEQTGLSKSVLSKTENGGNATLSTIYRICRALDLHPRYVLPDFKKF
jgi:transcriptional regulator with XRE-family HTH domain